MNLPRDDRPRLSLARHLLHTLRATEPEQRIAWAAVVAGGGVGGVAVLIIIETLARWIGMAVTVGLSLWSMVGG